MDGRMFSKTYQQLSGSSISADAQHWLYSTCWEYRKCRRVDVRYLTQDLTIFGRRINVKNKQSKGATANGHRLIIR